MHRSETARCMLAFARLYRAGRQTPLTLLSPIRCGLRLTPPPPAALSPAPRRCAIRRVGLRDRGSREAVYPPPAARSVCSRAACRRSAGTVVSARHQRESGGPWTGRHPGGSVVGRPRRALICIPAASAGGSYAPCPARGPPAGAAAFRSSSAPAWCARGADRRRP